MYSNWLAWLQLCCGSRRAPWRNDCIHRDSIFNGTQKEAWNRLIRFEINEIEKLFLSGRTLLPLLPRPGRAVFSGFLGIYHAILIQIAKDPEVVWRKRVRVGSIRKSQIMLQALRIKWIGF